jgi:hypothetical protein
MYDYFPGALRPIIDPAGSRSLCVPFCKKLGTFHEESSDP